jgi:hypothetical protein
VADSNEPRRLWRGETLDRDLLPLRWPLRLNADDLASLAAVVEGSGDVRLPERIKWRAARRATLLDALKRVGRAWQTIPATVRSFEIAFAWLDAGACPIPRATAQQLVNNVPAAQAAGDVFSALPLEVIFIIVDWLMLQSHLHATRDVRSAALASRAFGLAAAVNEQRK